MKTLAAAILLTIPVQANALIVYSQDFEGGAVPAEFSGTGNLATTGGLSAFGFGATHLHNPTATPTLMNLIGLGPHDSVTLTFDLAMWDSIDLGGDQFVVQADGADLYNSNTDFGNYFPGDNIGHGPGNNITSPFDGFTVPDYGQNTGFHDSGRHVSFTFAHSAPNLSVSWAYPNSQTAPDESFGIDNVSVNVNVVPEPSTMALSGLVLAAMLRRRRR